MVPELVGKLRAAGYEVVVQTGAGARALISDEAYRSAGASVTVNPLEDAVLVLSVQPLEREIREVLRPGTTTLSFFPYGPSSAETEARRTGELTTFGMEYVPRISRAQSMDALSSQALVLGAGVAGLQAIATCKRLGAVVKGYDVRVAAAEEIRSMGAVAIDLGLPSLEGAGGYAREMTEERA